MSKPPLKKRILKHPLFLTAVCRLAWMYIKFVRLTCRVKFVIAPEAEPYVSGEKNCALLFWHGRLLMMPYSKPKQREMHVLISDHADGRLISQVMTYFDIDTVVGSRSKGAVTAAKNMLRVIKGGHNICITPDGPRGPFQKVAPGVPQVPLKAGIPFLPSAFSASRMKRLSSWDRFVIPMPFSQLIYVVDAPLHLSASKDPEEQEKTRLFIQEKLTETTNRADMLAGHEETR